LQTELRDAIESDVTKILFDGNPGGAKHE
jgi:hypothetical protein